MIAGLFSGESLLYVGYNVVDILYAYRQTYEVGCHSGLAQLFVGELAVCVAGRMEHTGAGVCHMGDYCYEFKPVHEFYGVLACAVKPECYHSA